MDAYYRGWLLLIFGGCFFGGIALSYLGEEISIELYALLELLMIGVAIVSMVISMKNYRTRKCVFKKEIQQDLVILPMAINDMKKKLENLVPYPVLLEEPLFLSLEEQYEYAQHLRNGQMEIKSEVLRNKFGIIRLFSNEAKGVYQFLRQKTTSNLIFDLYSANVISANLYARLNAIDFGVGVGYKKYISDSKYTTSFSDNTSLRLKEWEESKDKFIYRITQGVSGEKEVVNALNSILRSGTVLENIRIEDSGTSAESDIIYVGPSGLYTLEIKNIGAAGNWNIKVSKDGQWQKVFQNGHREAMKDIGSQLNHHITCQEQFLNKKLKERYGQETPYFKMKGAIVISNDAVIIDNESDLVIRRKSSLNRYLEDGTEELSELWQTRIVEIFKEFTLPGKRYEVMNYEAVYENILIDLARDVYMCELRYSWLKEFLKASDELNRNSAYAENFFDIFNERNEIDENEISA